MILLDNPKQVSVQTLHKKLNKTSKDYQYDMKEDFITVSKEDSKLQFNLLSNNKKIGIVLALPSNYNIIVFMTLIGILTLLMQYLQWSWLYRGIAYILSYFVARILANVVYALQHRKQIKPIQKDLETTIKKLL